MGVTVNSSDAAWISGATYRQIDVWDRGGIVPATVAANGSGSRRRYGRDSLINLTVAVRLRSVGFELPSVKEVLAVLAQMPDDADTLRLAAGPSVDLIVDLADIRAAVDAALADLPAEPAQPPAATARHRTGFQRRLVPSAGRH